MAKTLPAKPIALFRVKRSVYNNEMKQFHEVNDMFQQRLRDYHVICIPEDDDEVIDLLSIEVFNDAKFQPTDVEKLKEIIYTNMENQKEKFNKDFSELLEANRKLIAEVTALKIKQHDGKATEPIQRISL